MDKKLTMLQAFNAMATLFDIYYFETNSDDLGGLLGSMSFLSDNTTADPALWDVWIESIDSVLAVQKIKHENEIDLLHAFLAIKPFLEYFFNKEYYSQEIVFFIENINNLREHKAIDNRLWNNWLMSVDEVLSIENSRNYLTLL